MATKKHQPCAVSKSTAFVNQACSLLLKLRAHPGFQNIVNCMEFDRVSWLASEKSKDEEYPGEARERREAYEIAIELLTGKKV